MMIAPLENRIQEQGVKRRKRTFLKVKITIVTTIFHNWQINRGPVDSSLIDYNPNEESKSDAMGSDKWSSDSKSESDSDVANTEDIAKSQENKDSGQELKVILPPAPKSETDTESTQQIVEDAPAGSKDDKKS